MCQFLASNSCTESFTEILKIASYFFSIPGHNANCERIFSLIEAQWTKERNRLSVETVRDIVSVKFNFKKISCSEFYKYLLRPENSKLLRQIGDSRKY